MEEFKLGRGLLNLSGYPLCLTTLVLTILYGFSTVDWSFYPCSFFSTGKEGFKEKKLPNEAKSKQPSPLSNPQKPHALGVSV